MKRKIVLVMSIIAIISACKKDRNGVNAQLTAHYLFKPGTYWIYANGGTGDIDSQYVTATGTKNGMPYMQINENLNGHHRATIYIGAGPAGNQLQLWGYDFLNTQQSQTIFQIDIPSLGATVAQGLVYAGTGTNGTYPYHVTADPQHYTVLYDQSNKNNEYGDVDYYFSPDLGIVEKDEYGTSLGDVAWVLTYAHIVQ